MNDQAISVDRVTKSFGTTHVLQGATLQIPAGQTYALLGRNGAGKSTLIQILLGLLQADSGSVRLGGIDPQHTESNKLLSLVGYLAEDQTMYPWMTPVELCNFLAPFYPTWDSVLANDFLDRFDIPRKTRIGNLSKGQSVKLGLTIALAHRPNIVILDDPSLGLDPIARKEFNRSLVEHLQVSGATVLYSSHLLDEVEPVVDGVAILNEGRIVRASETDSLRDDVKQILLPFDVADISIKPKGLLDIKRVDDRLAITTDNATEYLHLLANRDVPFQVVDLSLDEIFEAYVTGRTESWPPHTQPVNVSV